jgi:hypothetical protein
VDVHPQLAQELTRMGVGVEPVQAVLSQQGAAHRTLAGAIEPASTKMKGRTA